MIKSDGKCKIDGVELGELTYTVLGAPTPVLSVKYAYVSSATGGRYGHGHMNTIWSETTMARLAELVASVEADVAAQVFDGGSVVTGKMLGDDNDLGEIPSL